MQLLNLFQTGGLTLGLTIVWGGLTSFFMVRAIKAHNSGGIQQGTRQPILDDNKTPFHKIPYFWGAIIVTGLYIFALVQVASDYRGA